MITNVNQRWRDRRGTFIVPADHFDPRDYEVAYMPSDNEAKAFVNQHHYEGGFPAARFRYGLYSRRGELCGVAVYAVPGGNKATFKDFPFVTVKRDEETRKITAIDGAEFCVALSRFVLLDQVEANAESWFIARCHELLRRTDVRGIVSFSDPFPRTNRAGEQTFAGHVGCIYQATNAVYVGRSRAETKLLFPDGTMVAGRSKSKLASRDKGAGAFARTLEQHGAPPLRPWDDMVTYVKAWLPLITRPIRHTGNHKYVWALHRRDRKRLPDSLAYPKMFFEPSPNPQLDLLSA